MKNETKQADLKDCVILYDDSCPMCQLYTQGFVKMNLLKPENRVGFANATESQRSLIDLNRARHEIPLIDSRSGVTIYGIDALFFILQTRFPILIPLFKMPFFRGFWYALYQVISYNRRLIAGTSAPKQGFDCAPDFSLKYRLAYLAFVFVLWLILASRTGIVFHDKHQLALQSIFVSTLSLQALMWGYVFLSKKGWDYAGNLATNCLIFCLLISPVILVSLPIWAQGFILSLAVLLTGMDIHRRFRSLQSN